MSQFAAIIARGGFMSSDGTKVFDPALGYYVDENGKPIGSVSRNFDVTTGVNYSDGHVDTTFFTPLIGLTDAEKNTVAANYVDHPEWVSALTERDKSELRTNLGSTPSATFLPPAVTITPIATTPAATMANPVSSQIAPSQAVGLNANRIPLADQRLLVGGVYMDGLGNPVVNPLAPTPQVLPENATTAPATKNYLPYILGFLALLMLVVWARKRHHK